MISVQQLIEDKEKLNAAGPANHPDISPFWTKWFKTRTKIITRALEDFWYFVSECSGATNLYEPYHRPLCEALQQNKDILILLPRGTLKSTISTELYPIWLALKYPNIRVLIASYKQEDSEGFVYNQLKVWDCPSMKVLWPKAVPTKHGVGWWDLGTRTIDCKEPTVGTKSIQNGPTSYHFNVLICDDIIGQANYRSPTELENAKDWLWQQQATLDKSEGLFHLNHNIVVGTSWVYESVYKDIQEMPSWMHVVGGCYNEDGTIACPTKLDEEFLKKYELEHPSLFAAHYLNTPRQEADKYFPQQDIEWGLFDEINTTGMHIFCGIDPAASKEATADSTSFTIVGVDGANQVWVLENITQRLTPIEIYRELVRIQETFNPRFINMEYNGVGIPIYNSILESARNDGLYLPINKIKSKGNKEERIKWSLEPLIRGHRLHIKRSCSTLISQLLNFPLGLHDDAPDSLSIAMVDMTPGYAVLQPTNVKQGLTPEYTLQRLREAQARDPNYKLRLQQIQKENQEALKHFRNNTIQGY